MKYLNQKQIDHLICIIKAISDDSCPHITYKKISGRLRSEFNANSFSQIKERDYARACRFLGVFPRKSLLNPEIHPIKAVSSPPMADEQIKATIKQISLQLNYLQGLAVSLTNSLSSNSETVH